jgi:hydroxyacylglutathione hydrolase
MLLKYFYDPALAHASYLVGCQRTGEAIVVDPAREIDQYLEAAGKEGLRIVAAAETHIHADYVSGVRELAERVGATIYVSDCGPKEWKYEYASKYRHQLVKDGDTWNVGKVEFQVLHTPGHTPESISLVLTDRGGGATQPMGVFTGDFVFVGSIGRPDLLERAAKMMGTAEVGARDLFKSIARFRALPDYLQVWPAHGAGSACGKGLGAVPSSTVGYEKLFNPALQFSDEEEFVRYILAEQPEAPPYFALMKRINKEGPPLLRDQREPVHLDPSEIPQLPGGVQLLDASSSAKFAAGHVPGAMNIPASMLGQWAGWLIDYGRPLYLIAGKQEVPRMLEVLRKIGIDDVPGWFEIGEVAARGLPRESLPAAAPQQLSARIRNGEVTLLDVRSQSEWDEMRIPEAQHAFLGRLPEQIQDLDSSKPIVLQCRSGMRSTIAASLLQAAGIKNVINLSGGITAWAQSGLPLDRGAEKEAVSCRG